MEWQTHDGGDCPAHKAQIIIVKFRNGQKSGPVPASQWRWVSWPDGPSDFDIVAWRRP